MEPDAGPFTAGQVEEQLEQIVSQLNAPTRSAPQGSDLRLVEHLHRLYPPDPAVARALARVQERLAQRQSTVLAPPKQREQQTTEHPPVFPERPRARRDPLLRYSHVQGRSYRLASLVASALLVLLVGSLAAGLILVRHGQIGGTGPRVPTAPSLTAGATSPSPSGGAVVFTSLQMIDATTGWATGTKGQAWRVWHTTTGGGRWRDVTPPSSPALDFDTGAFLTASLAWVALRQSPDTLVIVRTTDGGQTWQPGGVIPSAHAVQMTFSTAQHGWVLANVGGDVTHETADLFQTTDGGAAWAKVASTQPQTAPGTLPADGFKGGLGFLTASTGWLTGAPNGFDACWLWVTHDGGRTWQAQVLALPWLDLSQPQEVSLETTPPRFFNVQEGVLPVLAFDAMTQSKFLVLYRTQDGGATWQSTTPVQATIASFSDNAHGWATNGTTLWRTSDGGTRWTALPASTAFIQVEGLDAVSSLLGWALRTPSPDGDFLLKTTDGGQTWVVVHPVEGS